MTYTKLVFFYLLLFPSLSVYSQKSEQPPNVLFISIDDLRPELGCYGNEIVQSPNLDKLASQGHLFTNHFVTVPTCGASRYGLLTGLYPRTKTAVSNDAIRKLIAEKPEEERPETFVANLRRNGYYTVGIGKISHYVDGLLYGYTDPVGTKWELPDSWDEMLFNAGKWGTGWNAFFGYADGSNRQGKERMVKPYEAADVPDTGYPDGLTTELALQKLQELATKDQPFFLGIGFFKPHLPFNAPQKYWDLYDRSDIPLTNSPDIPANVHPASLHNNGEFNHYKLGDEPATLEQPVSDEYARKLKHGYYASVSYIDTQVGKVLDELARLGLDKNTIVVVWGDHGWHLGDDRIWGKHTNFEYALNSVFMIKTPDNSQGQQHDEIVSTVDIYPTLMELCGTKHSQPLDGSSLVNLLDDSKPISWRNTAYSYFRQGVSVRTDRYRLTIYSRGEKPTVELYDHQIDPYENENIASQSTDLVNTLLPVWEKGNTGVYE